MPAPKKITRREKRAQPRLSTFLKSLNLKRFRKTLPRGERDPRKLYYTPESLLKANILRLMLNLTYVGLENFLRSHQRYATACGFPRGYVPDQSYYCKFFTALDDELLEQIGVWILQQLARWLDISCKVIAIDSSCFKAWANSFSKRADPDAATGKSATKGWFFGYKAHLAIDAQTEIPVALIITPGNGYDGHQLRPLLDKVMRNLSGHIQVVTADKGYDAGYNYLDIIESFQALPIIPKRGETDPPRLRQLTLENFLVIPEPILPATSPRDVKKREQYYRHSPPLPRDDPRWSGLATLRLSAERAIGRYKAFFCPERVRTRRLPRVKKWLLLGWLGMLASALFLVQRGLPQLIRSFPYVI